jgi:hypothetical protein
VKVELSDEAHAQVKEIDAWWRENHLAAPDLFTRRSDARREEPSSPSHPSQRGWLHDERLVRPTEPLCRTIGRVCLLEVRVVRESGRFLLASGGVVQSSRPPWELDARAGTL